MPVHLGEVLFPLRYDVVVQAPVAKALSHLHEDIPGLLEAGRDTPIYHHIGLAEPVYQKMELMDELSAGSELDCRTEKHYRNRIKKLIACYHSISEGWDTRRGLIYYKRVVNPTVTTSGFPLPGDGPFLGDGQHRTTALLALGYVTLPDSVAVIEVSDGYQPVDMTYGYIQAGHCTEQQFVDFARFRFPKVPEQIGRVQALADWMKDNAPEWAVEYTRIYWGVK